MAPPGPKVNPGFLGLQHAGPCRPQAFKMGFRRAPLAPGTRVVGRGVSQRALCCAPGAPPGLCAGRTASRQVPSWAVCERGPREESSGLKRTRRVRGWGGTSTWAPDVRRMNVGSVRLAWLACLPSAVCHHRDGLRPRPPLLSRRTRGPERLVGGTDRRRPSPGR